MQQIHEATDRSRPTKTDSSIAGGQADVADMGRRLARYFVRAQSRQRVMASVRGLLSEVERKNSWQVAEACGASTPYGFQYLLARADWDADLVRDARRTYLIPHLGDPHGVLVLDDTGVVNKGRHSAGVARQSTGTVGTVEHCQIGVLLGYASPLGHALLDRDLSLPQAWTDDRARCGQAGIPADRPCATKPQVARQLLARAFAAGVPATWVTGASVDGAERRRRLWLEAQPQPYALAVAGTEDVWLGWQQRQVNSLLATVPEDGWTRLRAGDGATGPRGYDWCWRPLTPPLAPGWCRWLLVRRSLSAPTDLTAYVVFAPQVTTLPAVVRVAGSRWTSASGVEEATGAVGLDHDEVRRGIGWYRHLTLAMWAVALLTSRRAGTIAVEVFKKRLQPPSEASPLAAFKARRGLASHCASPNGGGCAGG